MKRIKRYARCLDRLKSRLGVLYLEDHHPLPVDPIHLLLVRPRRLLQVRVLRLSRKELRAARHLHVVIVRDRLYLDEHNRQTMGQLGEAVQSLAVMVAQLLEEKPVLL